MNSLGLSRLSSNLLSRPVIQRLLISIIGLFICIVCNAQTGYMNSFTLNELGMGHLGDFTPKTIYLCSDNSLLILGDAGFIGDTLPEWYYVPLIIKLDPQGNLLWHRVISAIYENIIGVGIEQNDVVHFIVGRPSGYRVGSIDANGFYTLHWPKLFHNLYAASRFNKGLRLDNGEIVACGRLRELATSGYSAAFFRLSPAGDSLAATYYPADTNDYDYSTNGVNLAYREDNTFYLASYLNSDNLSVLHTNLDGSIINRYDIGGSIQYYGTTMFLSPDSLTVFTIDSSGGNHDTLLTSIDISGIAHTYNLGSERYCLYSVVSTSEYLILLGGDILRAIGITKFNHLLSEVWSVAYDTIKLTSTSLPPIMDNIILDQQGCIYFVGTTGVTNIVAVKLLPSGQVSNSDDLYIPAPQPLYAYPNPAQDLVTIEFNRDSQDDREVSDITIYNIRGQKVRSLKADYAISSHVKLVWDRRDSNGWLCPAGIYLITINNESQALISKKVTIY